MFCKTTMDALAIDAIVSSGDQEVRTNQDAGDKGGDEDNDVQNSCRNTVDDRKCSRKEQL